MMSITITLLQKRNADTGLTLFELDTLLFQLLRLPSLKFRFHAFVALFSVTSRRCLVLRYK